MVSPFLRRAQSGTLAVGRTRRAAAGRIALVLEGLSVVSRVCRSGKGVAVGVGRGKCGLGGGEWDLGGWGRAWKVEGEGGGDVRGEFKGTLYYCICAQIYEKPKGRIV